MTLDPPVLRPRTAGTGGTRLRPGSLRWGGATETCPHGPNQAIYARWRAESARLIGALTGMTHDVSLAEDLAQDALVAALEQWPATGVPDNPVAWLMTTAKRRAIDHFRRADSLRRKVAELEHAEWSERGRRPASRARSTTSKTTYFGSSSCLATRR